MAAWWRLVERPTPQQSPCGPDIQCDLTGSSSLAPHFTDEEARTQEFREVCLSVETKRSNLESGGAEFKGQSCLPAGAAEPGKQQFPQVHDHKMVIYPVTL